MNTTFFITNFKKEIWEFNKTLFWVPLIILLLVVSAPLIQFIVMEDYQANNIIRFLDDVQHREVAEDFNKIVLGAMTGLFVPFVMVSLLVQFYYFITCLYDERRDLSVYFWRSLPVSDAASVGIKLATGALLIPAIFMFGATAAALVYALFGLIASVILSAGYDISLWQLWASADLVTNLMAIWISLLPYALWMLPVYAWLMLASMFAQKGPFLWAVLPVVVILLVEAFVVEYFQLHQGFFSQMLFEYFTFSEHIVPVDFIDSDSPKLVMVSALLKKIELSGILLGGALMYLTYWLRANRSHP
mgnify:CR=1 FL=1